MTGPGRLVEGLLVHGAGLVVALLILGILIALTACDGEQSAPPTRTSASLEPTPAAVPTQTQAQSPIETLEPAPTPITAVGSTQPATPERLPTATPTPTRIPTAMPIPTVTADSAISSATEAQAQVVSAVTVTPAAATLVAGDTLRLSPQAKDANSHAIAGAVFAWASSDTLVARVDGYRPRHRGRGRRGGHHRRYGRSERQGRSDSDASQPLDAIRLRQSWLVIPSVGRVWRRSHGTAITRSVPRGARRARVNYTHRRRHWCRR